MINVTGNKVTFVLRFNGMPFIDGSNIDYLFRIQDGTITRAGIFVGASDDPDSERRNKVVLYCKNDANSAVCHVFSTIDVMDGENHLLMASYDGDLGIVTLIVDGVDVAFTGAASYLLTTGNLPVGALTAGIGATATGTALFTGKIGYVGYDDQYRTNYSDFMLQFGDDWYPLEIDEVLWTEWGGTQPLVWNQFGQVNANKGSADNFLVNGNPVSPPDAPDIISDTFTITVPLAAVASNLTDFPLRIDERVLPTTFWDTVTANGLDIIIKDSLGTVLSRQVAYIDVGAETCIIYVKTDLTSAVDTVLTLEIGDGVSEPNDTDVWPTDCEFAVAVDTEYPALDLTGQASKASDETWGAIYDLGTGYYSGYYVTWATLDAVIQQGISSLSVTSPGNSAYRHTLIADNGNDAGSWSQWGSWVRSGIDPGIVTEHGYAVKWVDNVSRAFYFDGSLEDTGTPADVTSACDSILIGAGDYHGADPWGGDISEVRFYSNQPTDDWIAFEDANVRNIVGITVT